MALCLVLTFQMIMLLIASWLVNWMLWKRGSGAELRQLEYCGGAVGAGVASLFRIPHMPLAGSLKVLRAPARWGGIRRASQTKMYNLETNEFVSNLPFLKTNSAGVISFPTSGGNN
jgi:hypothetical protein